MPAADTIPAPPKGFVLDDDGAASPSSVIPPPPKGFSLDLSPQEASAGIDQVTRPRSPAPVAPSSATGFSWQNPPQARSTAEGLVTEEQERRGGMPLAIQAADYGLENAHPERVVARARPNTTLSEGAQPNVTPEPDLGPQLPGHMASGRVGGFSAMLRSR